MTDCLTLGDYRCQIDDGGAAAIIGYTGHAGALEIPEEIGGHRVVSIGEGAFASCTGMTALTLPDSLAEIGVEAFSFSDRVALVVVPGSEAEDYARSEGIRCVYSEAEAARD